MNPVLKRIVTALTTAAIVVAGFCYLPLLAIKCLLVIVGTLVQLEFFMMISKKYAPMTILGTILGFMLLAVSACSPSFALFNAAPFIMFLYLLLIASVATFSKRYPRPLETMCATLFGIVYVSASLCAFTMYLNAEFFENELFGRATLLFVILATKLSDMGGFAFGMLSKSLMGNNHKMCPTISPNKSWEGFAGSVLGSVLACLGYVWYVNAHQTDAGLDVSQVFVGSDAWCFAIVLGAIFAVVATVGDLVESKIKRDVDVKDSATFMPAGLGGFLDMFDSLIFTPAMFLVVMFVADIVYQIVCSQWVI